MQGQSDCLSENQVVENAWEYKWLSDELVPLKNPVGENITTAWKEGQAFDDGVNLVDWLDRHITGSACYNHTNLVPAFCREYTAMTNRQVTAVHIAKGSTAIAQWLPNSDGYKLLVEKANAAKAKCQPDNIYLVWLQGESDAILGRSQEEYQNDLETLCAGLKQEVGISRFGIIRVGRFVGDARDDAILDAQDTVCQQNEDFVMLTRLAVELNQQPEYMHPLVAGHYSAKGLEALGKAAGQTLAALVQ